MRMVRSSGVRVAYLKVTPLHFYNQLLVLFYSRLNDKQTENAYEAYQCRSIVTGDQSASHCSPWTLSHSLVVRVDVSTIVTPICTNPGTPADTSSGEDCGSCVRTSKLSQIIALSAWWAVARLCRLHCRWRLGRRSSQSRGRSGSGTEVCRPNSFLTLAHTYRSRRYVMAGTGIPKRESLWMMEAIRRVMWRESTGFLLQYSRLVIPRYFIPRYPLCYFYCYHGCGRFEMLMAMGLTN